jgi:hypothetical protein
MHAIKLHFKIIVFITQLHNRCNGIRVNRLEEVAALIVHFLSRQLDTSISDRRDADGGVIIDLRRPVPPPGCWPGLTLTGLI